MSDPRRRRRSSRADVVAYELRYQANLGELRSGILTSMVYGHHMCSSAFGYGDSTVEMFVSRTDPVVLEVHRQLLRITLGKL